MLRISEDLRTVTSFDGGVALHVARGTMFRLNATGALVLDLLAHRISEEAIAHEISQRCGVEVAEVSTDVHDFLAVLKNHGLLDTET